MEKKQKKIIITVVAVVVVAILLVILAPSLGILKKSEDAEIIKEENYLKTRPAEKIKETEPKKEELPAETKKQEEIVTSFQGDCGVIVLEDFDEKTCTRTRSIVGINTLGFFPLGAENMPRASQLTGASFLRRIVQWPEIYDAEGNFHFENLDNLFKNAQKNNLKIILSLRSNHPQKSSVTFVPAETAIKDPDSLPQNAEEWRNYVKKVVERYKDQGLIAVATTNEIWQFQTNLPKNDPNYEIQKRKDMVALMKMTYESVKAVDPQMIVLSPALVGGDVEALAKGYNENGFIYEGNDQNRIRIMEKSEAEKQIKNGAPELFRKEIIVTGAPYYDYLNLHQRFDFPNEVVFHVNWARDILKNNKITGKGIIGTEFGGPFSYYSPEYHEYMITAGNVLAYYAGFDSITWSYFAYLPGWFNYNYPALVDENGNLKQGAVDAMKKMADATKNFKSVRRISENVYEFTLPNGQKKMIDVTLNVPIPAGYTRKP